MISFPGEIKNFVMNVDSVAHYPYALMNMGPPSKHQKITQKMLTVMGKLMQDIITWQIRECIKSQTTDV